MGMLIIQNVLFYFKTLYTKSKSIKWSPEVANLKVFVVGVGGTVQKTQELSNLQFFNIASCNVNLRRKV